MIFDIGIFGWRDISCTLLVFWGMAGAALVHPVNSDSLDIFEENRAPNDKSGILKIYSLPKQTKTSPQTTPNKPKSLPDFGFGIEN